MQNFNIQVFIHYAFENTDLCTALTTDSRPNVEIQRMFRSKFRFWCFTFLPATESTMGLKLHSTLISVYHICEVIIFVLFCPIKSLQFISISNELAVSTTSKGPS